MPAEFECERRRQERPGQRADVDAHVENRESRVPARAALRVELRDDRADVGFEKSDPECVQHQSEEEDLRDAGDQRRVADHDEHGPGQHRSLLADQPVRDVTAQQRQQVAATEIQAIDGACRAIIDAQSTVHDGVRHEQDQHRSHAVVGEPFPHLCEEQRVQSARLSEELATGGAVPGGGFQDPAHAVTGEKRRIS